jgi:hypothetical protein
MVMSEPRVVELSYRPNPVPDAWVLPDEQPVPPESRPHDLTIDRLRGLLCAWITRTGRDAIVARNLAVRWLEERPTIGVDPDVALIEPSPPDPDNLMSLKLWKPGHPVPRLAIEVVSASHPYKDYAEVQDRYAAFGVSELWVLDGMLRGPRKLGGPVAIQIWRSSPEASFARVYHGAGPAYSKALDAFVLFAEDKIQIADDREGKERWPTELEVEAKRAEAEAKRAEAEAKRAEAEAKRAEAAGLTAEAEKRKSAELEERVRKLEELLSKSPR